MQPSIMLSGIMFVDRITELERLGNLLSKPTGGLLVLYGRRRIGKSRLLVEWCRAQGGLYWVADQSSAEIQRTYFAETVASRLPGFADVTYPDWSRLLTRLARDAKAAGWRGPIVFDELPYLVLASPELPSVLQRWLDHEAREAGLVVALAGSSQRMMQGLVLAPHAPLFGRAVELFELGPIPPGFLTAAFASRSPLELVEIHTAWGGVPRYWELARDIPGPVTRAIDALVLDPLGPLHQEPDRLLLEELPPAMELRPLLDAIGAGAHRLSEIAGRLGRPATSMARPLDRLVGMGLVRREVPFGEPEKSGKRSLYKIADPFFRLWFRVVAPNRGRLAGSPREARLALLEPHWNGLVAQAWEGLCRQQLPHVVIPGAGTGWAPAQRWWRGQEAEWDVVSRGIDGSVLLGEAKWSRRPVSARDLDRWTSELAARPVPAHLGSQKLVRALFVPALETGVEPSEASPFAPRIITAADLLATT